MHDFVYICFLNHNNHKLRHYLLMTLKRKAPISGNMFGDVLVAGIDYCYGTSRYFYYKQKKDIDEKRYVDCKGNEELFKAVAAIRKFDDIHQWFFNSETGEFILSNEHKFEKLGFKKAGLDELKEFFKKK